MWARPNSRKVGPTVHSPGRDFAQHQGLEPNYYGSIMKNIDSTILKGLIVQIPISTPIIIWIPIKSQLQNYCWDIMDWTPVSFSYMVLMCCDVPIIETNFQLSRIYSSTDGRTLIGKSSSWPFRSWSCRQYWASESLQNLSQNIRTENENLQHI